MEGICLATTNSRAYYSALSRFKNTDLRLMSANPTEITKGFDLIVTTRAELRTFGEKTIAIEDLDDDPLIMKIQILSRLTKRRKRDILIGIDPGSRLGMAIYFGDCILAGRTFNSLDNLGKFISKMAKRFPDSSVVLKIGNGSPILALRIAKMMNEAISRVRIELVDERGTSSRPEGGRTKRDQDAAAKIALRKGMSYE